MKTKTESKKYKKEKKILKKWYRNLSKGKYQDKRIVLDKKRKTLRFTLPRRRFDKPFKEQERRGFPDYEFELSMVELNAMLKALDYKKGGKNHA